MKTLIKQTLMVSLAALALNGCRPDKFEDVGTPAPVAGTLAGTWKLSRVIQTDEDARNKGFTYGPVNVQQMDITNVFPYTDFVLKLNANGDAPTTFTTTPGNAPKIIRLASGSWSFDDPKYPKVLTMVNGTDTAKVTLGSYPAGSNPVLKIRSERRDASTGKLLISYSYEFTKQ